MGHFKPVPISTHGRATIFVPNHLTSCFHVFVHNRHITSSLHSIYLGLFSLKQRADKYFNISVNGTIKRFSIDRLKLTFF